MEEIVNTFRITVRYLPNNYDRRKNVFFIILLDHIFKNGKNFKF